MKHSSALKRSLGTALSAGTAAAGLLVSAGGSAADTPITTIAGGGTACSVQIDIYPRVAIATVMSGCDGGDYWLSSWATRSDVYSSSFPQRLFGMANEAPWVVPLPTSPPCFFQVDFSKRSAPPGQHADTIHLVLPYLGRTAGCVRSTTTTTGAGTTTSTTVSVGGTTSTSSTSTSTSTSTSSTSSVPQSVPTTTSTTLVPLLEGSIGSGQQGLTGALGQGAASSGSAPSGGLAFTGLSGVAAVLAAVSLLAFGLAAVEVGRIRRRSSGG